MRQGERGKTGDHGQDGSPGLTGPVGPQGPAGTASTQISEQVGAGFRALYIGLAIVAAGTLLALTLSFRQSKAICGSVNTNRSVLRNEHERKLILAQRQLSFALAFGRTRPIPAGFTRKDVSDSVSDARANVKIEQSVLKKVKPLRCGTFLP